MVNFENGKTKLNATNLNKLQKDLVSKTTINESGNVNLDDYTAEGRYFFVSNSSRTITNIPSGSNGFLEVYNQGSFVKQIWMRAGTPNTNDYETFVRTKSANGFGRWRRLTIEDEIYYKSGDTIDIGTAISFSGFITNDAKDMYFTIPLDKSMNNISKITVTELKGDIRTTSGKYLDASASGNTDFLTNYNVTAIKKSDRLLSILVTKSTAFANAINNTPLSVAVNVKLKFE